MHFDINFFIKTFLI